MGAAAGTSSQASTSQRPLACVSLEIPLQSTRDWKVKMLKFKAFCLDYWQFLCLQPLHGAYKR